MRRRHPRWAAGGIDSSHDEGPEERKPDETGGRSGAHGDHEHGDHEHRELVRPDPLVHPRAFSEIREAVRAAAGDDTGSVERQEPILRELETEASRLDSLAGLARQLVFGNPEAVGLFIAGLESPTRLEDQAGPRLSHPEEVEPIDRADDEPSFLNFEPIIDLHVGVAYAGWDDQSRAAELFAAVQSHVDRTLPAVDYLHLQAQRFVTGTLSREALLLRLDLFERLTPRIPQFDECMGALRDVLGSPGNALSQAIQSVQPDPNTARITSVQPSDVCSEQLITLSADPTNPFDPPTLPAGIKAFFAPCGQPAEIDDWKATAIRVRVPDGAESGLVSLGQDPPASVIGRIQEAVLHDFGALSGACPLLGLGLGSNLLVSVYSGLPVTLCKDRFVPVGAASAVSVRHKPRIGWFVALDQEGELIGSDAVEPCSPVRLDWNVLSTDPTTSVSLETDSTLLPSGPLAGAHETGARQRFRLAATNGCGIVTQDLSLNLSPPKLRVTPGDVMLKPGQTADVSISASCPVSADTAITLINSDPSSVSAPSSATLLAGTRDILVPVTGVVPGAPMTATATIGVTAPGYEPTAMRVWVERTEGEWRLLGPQFDLDMLAIHAVLLASGEVLFFSGGERGSGVNPPLGDMDRGESRRWDPATNLVEEPSVPSVRNLFCAAQCVLPDGRVFVAGGHAKPIFDFLMPGDPRHLGCDRDIHTYNPATDAWTRRPSMLSSRWYPTCVLLPSGKALIISGHQANPDDPVIAFFTAGTASAINETFDLFDPATGILSNAPNRSFLTQGADNLDSYPFLKVLPSGVLFVHTRDRTRLFFPDTTPAGGELGMTVSPEIYLQRSKNRRTYPAQGACVLLPLRLDQPLQLVRILILGGSDETTTIVGSNVPATDTAEIFDFIPALGPTTRQPGWRFTAKMSNRRFTSDAVLLADGKVLIVGGAGKGKAADNSIPVFQSELFDPDTEAFRPMDNQKVDRRYHGVALLLPDGRVVAAGGTQGFGGGSPFFPVKQMEIFFPPYLFRGPRPSITEAPAQIKFGTSFDISVDREPEIKTVALIRPGAVTHSNDMDQRYIVLKIKQRSSPRLTVDAPPDATIAPPGYYMLLVLTTNDIPSSAEFVKLA